MLSNLVFGGKDQLKRNRLELNFELSIGIDQIKGPSMFDNSDHNPDPAVYIDKHLAHYIRLNPLYTVLGSCMYDETSKYCPVLIQKGESWKQDRDQDNQAVQVWDDEGRCLYEHWLHAPGSGGPTQ